MTTGLSRGMRRTKESNGIRASNSRIVWHAWWSSLAANVERGWVQATTWTTNDAWFITSPSRRPARSRYSQDADKSTYIRKSEEEACARQDQRSSRSIVTTLPREGIWLPTVSLKRIADLARVNDGFVTLCFELIMLSLVAFRDIRLSNVTIFSSSFQPIK